jgi:hypothetical protein
MSNLKNFIDRVSDDTAQSFLQTIDSLGVAIDDPRIEDFLKQVTLIDELHGKYRAETKEVIETTLRAAGGVSVADVSKAVGEAMKVHSLTTDYEKLTDVVENALASRSIGNSTKVSFFANFDNWTIAAIAAIFGVVIGGVTVGVLGVKLLPDAMAQFRLQDAADIKYLHSKEGVLYRSIVQLNSGYLDTGRCKTDAATNGYFMTRGKDRVKNVCLLVMPQ